MTKKIKCLECGSTIGNYDLNFLTSYDCNLLNINLTFNCPCCQKLLKLEATSSPLKEENAIKVTFA